MRPFSINLSGRVKNFPLPKNRPLIPLYEAIVNSIHAIDERKFEDKSFKDGIITIEVLRSPQMSFAKELLPIEGFKITDNGVGFNERNMQSFLESDTTYKAKIGGKGVGRFSWLKAFKSVSISSMFKDNGVFKKREFIFSLDTPYIEETLVECEEASDFSTTVTLETYIPEYRKEVPKQIDTIAIRIMQHCLVYFLDDNCPKIIISDDNETIILNQIFKERFKIEENTTVFQINDIEFKLLNLKIEEQAFPGNRLYLCANNRLVESKDLEKLIVDLDGQIFQRYGFWYVGVLTSNYLDNHVDMNRLSFNMPESGTNIFDEISLEEIVNQACVHIKDYLNDYLLPIETEKLNRIKDYVTNDAPQYRHLLKYMPDRIRNIKPKLSDDNLDDALYEIKREFEKLQKKEQKELLEQIDNPILSSEEYEKYFKEQIRRISDANSAVLAEYVAHRRVILELFERGLRRKEDGKFNKEKYMHSLIYPVKSTSDDIDYESHNLWLIDEKLSYCSFISSDIPFDNDYEQERTDILILDNPVAVSDEKNDGGIFDTIIIFELKRPMRDDYTDGDNPITQLYNYVRKIRNGKAKDKYHRPIRVDNSTKYYLYAICDITNTLERFIEQYGFTQTPDKLGFYNFNRTFNAYFEILSYDKILNDAKKRNRVLFDKLGI
ncbi:hypothetical protein PTH_2497 [Pelotomaculum thermopropionicum SI]|uniref:ATP-binding protein n=1 Tax=Pelotomaculum thermopropionicum (strain DSM 13744 / JCM 10971 / SI) TaxID=370438 RepID=A5CZA9_PELTS|nr:hypothetical protein PTH_2497 [Pelotomaculum thermopropionicum SI]